MTGISAGDRAATIRALVDPPACAKDFSKPDHVFSLGAVRGGVLQRRGHTEVAVDLTRLAGVLPGGVIGELVNDDGTMKLLDFAELHRLSFITISELVDYRMSISDDEARLLKEPIAAHPTDAIFAHHFL